MSEQGTAVTTTAQDHPEVAAIKQAGAIAVERQKALNATTKQLAGMKFGDVSGGTLSPETRYAIAQLCQLTGANAGLHLFILGGRPYLNADYWAQMAAAQPHHLGVEQIPLTPDYSAELRKQADEAEKDDDIEDARRLRRLARHVDSARVGYGIPDTAKAAYETVIRRYAEHAPLAMIASGRMDGAQFIIEQREANWVGDAKRRDPVGDARPHETARTRSLRRCAVRTYSSTLAPMEEQLRKLENAIEVEFEVVASDTQQQRAALPAEGERQALRVGAGEPVAAKAEVGTREPAKGRGKQQQAAQQEQAPPPADEETREAERRFLDGAEVMGFDGQGMHEFAMEKLGRLPESAEDFHKLSAELARIADA